MNINKLNELFILSKKFTLYNLVVDGDTSCEKINTK